MVEYVGLGLSFQMSALDEYRPATESQNVAGGTFCVVYGADGGVGEDFGFGDVGSQQGA